MTFTKEELSKIQKKLESRFKKSKNSLVEKIYAADEKTNFSDEELKVMNSKFEYRFKKSEDELITKIRS